MKRWYVATTKTNNEFLAERELRKQGYLPWCPRTRIRIAVMTKKGETSRLCIRAYFLNYMFVKFDAEEDRWWPIEHTKGIISVITQCEKPVPVRIGVIERLINFSGESDFMEDERVDEVIRDLHVGDTVKVKSGAFAGFSGPVTKMSSHDRIRVMLSIFGKDSPIEMAREDVA